MGKDNKKLETNSKKIARNEKGQLQKGVVLNPFGRPKGSEDFKTKWFKFIDKVAKSNNMTPEEIDEQLLAIGFKKAKEGDYNFYKDIHDRVYGRAQQIIDVNADVVTNNGITKEKAEQLLSLLDDKRST